MDEENLETTTETLEQESRDHAAAYERLWKRLDEQDARIEALSLELLGKIADTNNHLSQVQAMVLPLQKQAIASPANCKCGALYRGGAAPGKRPCPVGCGAPRF